MQEELFVVNKVAGTLLLDSEVSCKEELFVVTKVHLCVLEFFAVSCCVVVFISISHCNSFFLI